jgi:hypothetical protein
MSARQNKKQRKGRNNANNRERTVTTLTEDPNTPFLVPTSSEEPAGANIMSSPFSVASSSAGNPNNIPPAAYQMPGNFGFGYNNFVGPMHGSVHHQQHQPQQQQQQQQQQPFYPPQQQPQQQLNLPLGQNDLEILEKLKEMIKNGQHEAYKAVPQPAALASIYLGPNSQAQVPYHPEQAPDFQHNVDDGPSQGNQPQNSVPSSPVDLGRRPPRIQSKDGWDPSGRKPSAVSGGGAQPINNVLSASSPDVASPANTVQFLQSNGGRYNQSNNGAPSAINTNLHGKANLTGPLSAGLKSSNDVHMSDTNPSPLTISTTGGPEPPSPSQRSARFDGATPSRFSGTNSSGNLDQARPQNDRLGHGESPYGSGPRGPDDVSLDKNSTFDGKDDLSRTPRESGWSVRDGPPPLDDRRRDSDRPLPSPTSRSMNGLGGPDVRPNGPDNRGPPPPSGPPRDDRYYDRDRERDRDRDRRDWDRERDRRPFDRFRDPRMTDARRPPPEQRHYEPDYDRQPIPRRYDHRGPDEPPVDSRRPIDVRAPPTPTPNDDRGVRPPLVDDRLSSARAPPGDLRGSIDSRSSHDSRAPPPDPRAPLPDNRPVRGPSFDDRNVKPSPADDRRGPPPADDRTVRAPAPPARPADAPGVGRPSADDRGVRASPLPPVEDRNARPQVPLEERLTRPSLQDRLSQPPSGRPEANHLSRQASLEERLSHPAVAPADLGGRPIPVSDDRTGRPASIPDRDRVGVRPGPHDERNGRPPSMQDDRIRLDDRTVRPVDRYTRPATPTASDAALPLHRPAAYPSPRAASVARDDPRVAKGGPPSPPHRPASRDYRPPGRPISRERMDVRTSTYRPDDRGYPDDRRPSDPMDVDAPPRYSDSRGVPYNRPFSPPSAADLARDRARAQFPPSPPRASVSSVDPAPYDAGGRDWQYQQYSERRREWSTAEEDNYWKSRPQWDRNNPPSDRERFERDVPPPPLRNHGWEPRDERDRRESFTRPSSPPRTFDGPPRPLSSRLTDNYSGPPPTSAPPVDRSYPPPRDAPSFNRVRQRSPSPARRPGPGPGPVDDQRPPMKRPRDDAYPSAGYYSPPARDAPMRRPGDYPSRGGSPPPQSGGSSYYDRGGPPPSSAGTSTSVPGDRDYPAGREAYPPPAAYDRPRSPGPPRGGYGRGGYARDDRRYPPPQPMAPPRRA